MLPCHKPHKKTKQHLLTNNLLFYQFMADIMDPKSKFNAVHPQYMMNIWIRHPIKYCISPQNKNV